jgi:hypothetical protein
MTAPTGPRLQVLGGAAVDLVHPLPEQIDFHTMACVLARVPRFCGHTDRGTLSVAQHCLEGARAIERDTGRRDAAAAFMLHDGHEYVLGDITTPVQDALVEIAIMFGNVYAGDAVKSAIRHLKNRLDVAIYTAAGITFPLPADVHAIVKEYDLRMCRTERDARVAPSPYPWADVVENAVPVEDVDLHPWSEGTVRALYSAALRKYGILK